MKVFQNSQILNLSSALTNLPSENNNILSNNGNQNGQFLNLINQYNIHQNAEINGNSSSNQSALKQLETVSLLQLIKQQQQYQQNLQREQYKLALINELLRIESNTQQQPQQQFNQFQEQKVNDNFNSKNKQIFNLQNLLLEMILKQNNHMGHQIPQQTLQFQQIDPFNAIQSNINSSLSSKYVEQNFEQKTLSVIPSFQSGSPKIFGQVSPQFNNQDNLYASIQHNQQNSFEMAGQKIESNQQDMKTLLYKQQGLASFQNNRISFSSQNQKALLMEQNDKQNVQENCQIQDIIIKQKQENELLQKKHETRLIKIERYRNKRRNWLRKISYDCRKKVADSRLRIKGRFISKKDIEKIKELIGDNNEAFNSKKNLCLDFMNNKMKQQNLDLNSAISKNEILYQIENLLIKNRQMHTSKAIKRVIKKIQKRQQVFCLIQRGQAEMLRIPPLKKASSIEFSNENEESNDTTEHSKEQASHY